MCGQQKRGLLKTLMSFTSQTRGRAYGRMTVVAFSSVFERFSVDGENVAKTIEWTLKFLCFFCKSGAFRKRISVDGAVEETRIGFGNMIS